jgi:FkbM family methyltransferase
MPITAPDRKPARLGILQALLARLAQAAANDRRVRALGVRVTRRWRHGEHVIRRGPAAGLRINLRGSRPSYVFGTAEPDTVRLLTSWLQPGDVFYDLGANVGYFTLVASRLVGPAGHVYAIEPSPTTARALRANVERNALANVTVVEAAAGREDGRAHLDPVDGEASQSARLLPAATTGGVAVRVVSIDSLVRGGARPPDVIKIDVEGAEEDAVLGMCATLAERSPSVVCEIHQTLHASEHPVETALREAGLILSWLEPEMSREAEIWAPHLVATAPERAAARC